MTITDTRETAVIGAEPGLGGKPYVDWAAAIAGILLASAIALVMLTFGAAIGLSFVNFHGGANASPVWVGIAAASWLLWVEVSAMMCGGYLTGRLRHRVGDATEHESDVRDGAHGLIVWAGAVLIGAIVTAGGIGGAASTVGSAVSTTVNAAASAAGPAAGGMVQNLSGYFADTLMRPSAATGAAPAPAGGSAGANRADAVAEAGRILVADAASGNVPDADKAYLADLVARTTGLTPEDARKRVNDVLAQIDSAKQKAADTAETARKAAVIAAFITAASLLVAAVGAYWAAMMGGNHRDRQVVFDYWFRRF